MKPARPRKEGTLLTLSHPDRTARGPALKHDSSDCRAISGLLARVGDKWTVLVVEILGPGPARFNELRRKIGGISQKMLTTTLRQLERDGMVMRTVYPTVPPRVDYELTELGRDLLVPVRALADWARQHVGRIEAARERYDAQGGT